MLKTESVTAAQRVKLQEWEVTRKPAREPSAREQRSFRSAWAHSVTVRKAERRTARVCAEGPGTGRLSPSTDSPRGPADTHPVLQETEPHLLKRLLVCLPTELQTAS